MRARGDPQQAGVVVDVEAAGGEVLVGVDRFDLLVEGEDEAGRKDVEGRIEQRIRQQADAVARRARPHHRQDEYVDGSHPQRAKTWPKSSGAAGLSNQWVAGSQNPAMPTVS